MQKHLSTIKSFIIVLALTVGVSYIFAWTGPTATPPNINAPAPINVSLSAQHKDGGLSAGGKLVSLADVCVAHMNSNAVVEDICLKSLTAGTGGGGLNIIGPLSDPAGTGSKHEVSFNLPTASEVLILVYAEATSDGAGGPTLKLYADDIVLDTKMYSEECSENCGGGAASVVFNARGTLESGNHKLKIVQTAGRGGIYGTTSAGGGVQFYVYLLNSSAPSGAVSGDTFLGLPSCAQGQVLTRQSGAWACVTAPTQAVNPNSFTVGTDLEGIPSYIDCTVQDRNVAYTPDGTVRLYVSSRSKSSTYSMDNAFYLGHYFSPVNSYSNKEYIISAYYNNKSKTYAYLTDKNGMPSSTYIALTCPSTLP